MEFVLERVLLHDGGLEIAYEKAAPPAVKGIAQGQAGHGREGPASGDLPAPVLQKLLLYLGGG
jgi:hypothetical protein